MITQPSSRLPLFALATGYRLVLASASPRRRLFLSEWGLPFELARPDGAEPLPAPGENPDAYTRRAATAKAHAVAAGLPGASATGKVRPHDRAIILAADTVVTVDGDILGKPDDSPHALDMLHRLSGRGHEVISAVCLLLPPQADNAPMDATESFAGAEELVFSDVSRVFFHPWPENVLRAYVETGEPRDKAGAYAIQGQGAFLVDRIEGSWSTVVGLPVTQLARLLLDRGFMLPCSSHRSF
ncbi:MAG: Maf family nucleotide pyrophosphatase [Desulfovibrio sp.]|nr:Maf family nucleotide pyrophosphatase [Desulfovibrio sp.]